MHELLVADTETAIPIWFVNRDNAEAAIAVLDEEERAWIHANGFEPLAGRHLLIPAQDGSIARVLFGLESADAKNRDLLLPGKLASLLPAGTYRFSNSPYDPRLATLSWLTSSYSFGRYKQPTAKLAKLVIPEGVDGESLSNIADALRLGRDLINTPANDLGPAELEQAFRAAATRFGAEAKSIVGEDLLTQGFPMIHAVGRASPRAPRLLDMEWGNPEHPKVTLVGKGVCFDTGGLNIKPESGMLLMKKDMGGAASVLATAAILIGAGAKVRLRVLIPAVDNSISGSAFRPGDVLPTRKGITVEIGNTDAEGRLVLGDALALADEEAPDLLVDMATLTGAARVAVGPDLPALFTDDDGLASELAAHGLAEGDPMWRLPLWRPYAPMLDSKIADVNHISSGPFAGSITAALFLTRFVEKAKAYAHLDMYCWNNSTKPGRPEGGEVMVARALSSLVIARYGVPHAAPMDSVAAETPSAGSESPRHDPS